MFSRLSMPVRILIVSVGVVVLAVAVYNIPFVHDKLSWRLDDLRGQIVAVLMPPQQGTFKPSAIQPIAATGSLPAPQMHVRTRTPQATQTSAGPTLTPTITPPRFRARSPSRV